MKLLVLVLIIVSLISLSLSMSPSYVGHNNQFNDIWQSCGDANDHFQITSVEISPDPPTKLHPVVIKASGTLNEDITGGTVKVVVKIGFITIFDHTESLCNSTFNPVGCPIKAGPYSRTVQTPVIPQQAPVGKYQGNVLVLDQNGGRVACINVNFLLK